MSEVLDVKKLFFSIEKKRILKDISIACNYHETLAILGQSGSGKSTLLKLIAGLLEPDKGSLTIEGQNIDPPSEKLIPGHPKIKIVKQDNPLFPNISLRENIEYELRFYESEYRDYRVNKLLKLTRLKEVADQLPRHSSEGEQQRTAIARAIAEEPALLLLDEPFSNLDHMNKARMKDAVSEIVREENMACIFVTHEVSDVFGMADRLAVLKSGKIIQMGGPIEVYKEPVSEYVASLTGEYTILSADEFKLVFGIKSKKKHVLIRPEHLKISPETGEDCELIEQINKGFYNALTLKAKGVKLKTISIQPLNTDAKIKLELLGYHPID